MNTSIRMFAAKDDNGKIYVFLGPKAPTLDNGIFMPAEGTSFFYEAPELSEMFKGDERVIRLTLMKGVPHEHQAA